MTSPALLDVNVLLALFDADHVDHHLARGWFVGEGKEGWASCAITENGFVRVLSQPRYPSPVTPREAVSRLARATSQAAHRYLPCDLSITDPQEFDLDRIHGPRQLTDVYLLALAARHEARFVTFDRSIPVAAARRAEPSALLILGAGPN